MVDISRMFQHKSGKGVRTYCYNRVTEVYNIEADKIAKLNPHI